MTSFWKKLCLSNSSVHTPPLLVKYYFGTSHYNMFVTDLTFLWTESLERKQIIKRALTLDTSIDPSEDKEQFLLLLNNIQKALDIEKASNTSLSRSQTSNCLDLSTITPLPAPLKPLQWRFNLSPAPQSMFTLEVLVPCLSHIASSKTQIASLLQQIKEKDHLVSRLIEKMQIDGSDLSKIFPGLSGLKVGPQQSVREIAGKCMKSLGVFNEEHWRNEMSKAPSLSMSLSDALSNVFSFDPRDTPRIEVEPSSATWWQHLKHGENPIEENAVPKFTISSQMPHLLSKSINGNTNDKKEIQECPAHSEYSENKNNEEIANDLINDHQVAKKLATESDDTTTDDSDGEVLTKSNQEPPQSSVSKPSQALLSGLSMLSNDDGLNLVHRATNFGGASNVSRDNTLSSTNDDTREDGILDLSILLKPKPRLGKIGGRTEKDKSDEALERDAFAYPNLPHDRDEGSQRQPSARSVSASSKTGQTPDKTDTSIVLQGTCQERANYKRESLKRELEIQGGIQAKKKRKF